MQTKNDLIPRHTAIVVLETLKEIVESADPVNGTVGDIVDALDVVRNVKAVDAVEVVRCKDCVYVELPKCCPYQINGFTVIPEWYCPMGVKTPVEVE